MIRAKPKEEKISFKKKKYLTDIVILFYRLIRILVLNMNIVHSP